MFEKKVDATGLMKKINDFYDTRASPWYKEATKHLVPSYNANRASEKFADWGPLGTLITLGAGGLDVGLFFGYIKGTVEIVKDLSSLFQ